MATLKLRKVSDKALLLMLALALGVLAITMLGLYQYVGSSQRAEIARDLAHTLGLEEQRKLAVIDDQLEDLRRNLAFVSHIPPHQRHGTCPAKRWRGSAGPHASRAVAKAAG